MEDYIINWTVTATIGWVTTFILVRKILSGRSFDLCNRVVSTLHALLAVWLASFSVQDWRCPVCPLASESSPWQMKTLAVSLSYLIYDLICCLFDDKHINIDNSVHHIVSIVGIAAGLAYRRCGSEMVAALWITEISSPFLHAREILKELGYRDTDLNLTFDMMAMGLQLVSAFWFYKIIRMVKYKLTKRMSTPK